MNASANKKSAYDSWHELQATAEVSIEKPHHPWHVTVSRLLPDLGDRRVLEIGCGRGDFANWLAARYPQAQITGVDFSDGAIKKAKQRAAERGSQVVFQVNDAEALTYVEGGFDYVISCECLEHVLHPERMAREIYRVLRPGGRFILTTENYFNGMLLAWLKSWLQDQPFNSGSGVQPHENFFVFWKVKKILERSGLAIDHMESNHFQWLLLPRVAPTRLCKNQFKYPLFNRLFRSFGRHFTFCGFRPN